MQNFQRHSSLSLTFSPTITSIQGATDAGKSSVLRSLRWVCLNDFGGSDFIREGASEASVALTFRHQKADHELTRSKTVRHNRYELDGTEYKAFATNVPEDISGCLRLNEINFQGQHDAPFWFNETAGEVSRRLNAVVDLSVIDSVLLEASATLREAESTVRVSEQRLRELNEDQEKLNPQLARIDHFETLKERNEAHEKQAATQDRLATLLTQCADYSLQLARLRPKIEVGSDLRKQLSAWFQRGRQLSALQQLAEEVVQLKQVQRPPDFQPIAQAYGTLKVTQKILARLEELVNAIRRAVGTAQYTAGAANEARKLFHQKIKGERCPTCQSQL